jgi:hypothetical protein
VERTDSEVALCAALARELEVHWEKRLSMETVSRRAAELIVLVERYAPVRGGIRPGAEGPLDPKVAVVSALRDLAWDYMVRTHQDAVLTLAQKPMLLRRRQLLGFLRDCEVASYAAALGVKIRTLRGGPLDIVDAREMPPEPDSVSIEVHDSLAELAFWFGQAVDFYDEYVSSLGSTDRPDVEPWSAGELTKYGVECVVAAKVFVEWSGRWYQHFVPVAAAQSTAMFGGWIFLAGVRLRDGDGSTPLPDPAPFWASPLGCDLAVWLRDHRPIEPD